MSILLYRFEEVNYFSYAGPFRCQEEVDIFKAIDGDGWIAVEGDYPDWPTIERVLIENTGHRPSFNWWTTEDYWDSASAIVRSIIPSWNESLDDSKDYERLYHSAASFDNLIALAPYDKAMNLIWMKGWDVCDGSWGVYELMLSVPSIVPDAGELISRLDGISALCEVGLGIDYLLENLWLADEYDNGNLRNVIEYFAPISATEDKTAVKDHVLDLAAVPDCYLPLAKAAADAGVSMAEFSELANALEGPNTAWKAGVPLTDIFA